MCECVWCVHMYELYATCVGIRDHFGKLALSFHLHLGSRHSAEVTGLAPLRHVTSCIKREFVFNAEIPQGNPKSKH